MKTEILKFNEIDKIASFLKEEKVVCFPTETVYGIGVICSSKNAYEELIKVKGRSPDKPISLMASSLKQAMPYIDVNSKNMQVLQRFFPGEVTFLLKSSESIDPWIDLKTGVVGLRVPASENVCQIIEKVGKPCLVTSANLAGQKTSTLFSETYDVFNTLVPCIAEGECTSNVASTIIDLTGEEPKLIRQGKLSFDEVYCYWRSL